MKIRNAERVIWYDWSKNGSKFIFPSIKIIWYKKGNLYPYLRYIGVDPLNAKSRDEREVRFVKFLFFTFSECRMRRRRLQFLRWRAEVTSEMRRSKMIFELFCSKIFYRHFVENCSNRKSSREWSSFRRQPVSEIPFRRCFRHLETTLGKLPPPLHDFFRPFQEKKLWNFFGQLMLHIIKYFLVKLVS